MSEQFKMTFAEWQEVTSPGGYYSKEILARFWFPWDQIIAYRHCKDGEYWVNPFTGGRCGPNLGDDPGTCRKVFILRPRKKVTVTNYVFKATGEVRPPRMGEWYSDEDEWMRPVPENGYTGMVSFPIYTREAVTREIEVEE